MSPSRRVMTTFTSNNNFGASGKPAKSKSKAKKAADNVGDVLSSDAVVNAVPAAATAAPNTTPTPETDKTLKIGVQANKPRTCACAPFVPKEHCVALFKGVPAPAPVLAAGGGAVTQAVVKANGFASVGVQVEAPDAPIVVNDKDKKDSANDAEAVKEKEGATNATTVSTEKATDDMTTTPMIIDTPLDAHKEKDLRAFEHDRQRAKNAKERAMRRARKENSGSNAHGHGGVRIVFGGASVGGAEDRSQSRSRERERWEALDETYVLGGVLRKTQAHAHAHAHTHGHGHASHGKSHSRSKSLKNLSTAEDDLYFGSPPSTTTAASTPLPTTAPAPAQQILLSDLVTSLSQRTYTQTQKKRRALSDEEPFEMVPNVRGVIALDEADFGFSNGQGNGGGMDMEDDGWECVSVSSGGGGGEKENVLSYAQVVLGVA